MATTLTKASYVVLGMIAGGWRTGYEISRKAAISVRFFWAASEGQIYPQLRNLADAGLIAGEAHPTGGRERNVFALTDAGRDALHDWLTDPAPAAYELRDEGLLKLFFADELDVGALRAQVALLRRRHERVLEDFVPIADIARVSPSATLVLHHGRMVHGAVVDWYRWLEDGLAGAPDDERAATALQRLLSSSPASAPRG